MERSAQRELQHVGLATACAVVYSKVTGYIPNPRDPGEMHAVLNDVAHALSNVVTIYAWDRDAGLPKPIAPMHLIEGQFLRGAQMFKSKGGDELRELTVQRRDMMTAISVLTSARINFPKPAK